MHPAVELIRDADLAIRPMQDDLADYEAISRWLSDPRVLEFYEGRDRPLSLSDAIKDYSPQELAADNVTARLVTLDDQPIGYAQYYPVNDDGKAEYGLSASEDTNGLYAFDQFIGEPERWNQGLGTRVVSLLVEHLFRDQSARKIVIDPQARNPRALRCYEKCGFRKVKLLPANELHEGRMEDCWLMELAR